LLLLLLLLVVEDGCRMWGVGGKKGLVGVTKGMAGRGTFRGRAVVVVVVSGGWIDLPMGLIEDAVVVAFVACGRTRTGSVVVVQGRDVFLFDESDGMMIVMIGGWVYDLGALTAKATATGAGLVGGGHGGV
jgi:hypothetical protein